jgi:hypothetical protein
MSDFYNAPETRKARRKHRCSYCGEEIPAGTEYVYQTGVYDGAWYTSKMHPECFADMCETDCSAYMPYSNERPVLEKTTAGG